MGTAGAGTAVAATRVLPVAADETGQQKPNILIIPSIVLLMAARKIISSVHSQTSEVRIRCWS